MLSVGVDMIEIARIERAMTRHGDRFYARFFTNQEREICDGQPARLAGRFAVKEAVGKALGTGIGDVCWTDIEVVCNFRGKPELVLHNQAEKLAAELGFYQWSISLSHTETHAIGFAVAMGKGDL
jgi:holo-[acyl-carrier protein] synthase